MTLCPKCGSAHVARTNAQLDNDTNLDYTCHSCGFAYSIPVVPEIELESLYDERYDGPAIAVIPSDPADDRQSQ